MNLINSINSWLFQLGERRRKLKMREDIKAQQQKEAEREQYYQSLKDASTPIHGRIARIEYMDIARLDPYNSNWEPEDIILWISFWFDNGKVETLQYYHKGTGDPRPEEREILRYSGRPNILECCTKNSEVIGYFNHDRLVALDNIPPANYYEN